MVSTFSPNIQLEEPARGDQVGVWDTPVNANTTLIDLVAGGQTTISGAAGSIVLSAAQFQCKTITFNSTLLASIAVTFPTSFMKSYEIFNTCTGSSAFVITLQTTAAGAGSVCCPPGEICEIVNIAGQIRFKNLGRVGSYWDHAGSSVPAWVSGSNPVPYLNCDATTFSAATFPQLAVILGSTTLPDFRGSSPLYLNQGTGRATSSGAGVDGNTAYARGGGNGVTLGSSHIPTHTSSGVNTISVGPGPTLTSIYGNGVISNINTAAGGSPVPNSGSLTSVALTGSNTVTVAFNNSSQQNVPATVPITVGGIRMIRAG